MTKRAMEDGVTTKQPATRKRSVAVAPAKREPKPREAAAIAAARERYTARPERPEPTVVNEGGTLMFGSPHSDEQGMAHQVFDAMGSVSAPFVGDSLQRLAGIIGDDKKSIGAALAIMAAVNPADELESALAQQMVAAHLGTLKMATAMQRAEMVPQLNAYGNLANKFARTFALQVDALNKLRNGGAQVVRHVHVHEGGQAIVADQFHAHTQGSRNNDPINRLHERSAALSGPDATRDAVPMPGAQGQETLQATRGSLDGAA